MWPVNWKPGDKELHHRISLEEKENLAMLPVGQSSTPRSVVILLGFRPWDLAGLSLFRVIPQEEQKL